jgi:hypothetical protein
VPAKRLIPYGEKRKTGGLLMEFYVYVWRDSVGVPFYVGKGKGRRAYDATTRSKEFKEIYAQGGCAVEIVDWFIHESQAHAHEVELIERYGRREFGGILINKTDGGEGIGGWVPSEEWRAKLSARMRGKPKSAEHISKMRSSRRGKKPSADAREKMSAAKLGIKFSDEHRTKISAALKGRQFSAEHRIKVGKASANRSEETLSKMRLSARMRPPLSGYKGVSLNAACGKWIANIFVDGKPRYLGRFDASEAAAAAYDNAAYAAWGWDCYLNFPDEIGDKIAA